jgi:hypothetical protein
MTVQTNTETHMDWNRVEGNWKQLTGKVKKQWGQLTDDRTSIKRDALEAIVPDGFSISSWTRRLCEVFADEYAILACAIHGLLIRSM